MSEETLVERLRLAAAYIDGLGMDLHVLSEAADRIEELETKARFVDELVHVYRSKDKSSIAAQGQGMDGYTLLAHYDDIAKRATNAEDEISDPMTDVEEGG